MTCDAGRCSIEASGPRSFSAELTLMSSAPAKQPVLVEWTGCGAPTTTLFATWSGSDYVVTYTTQFSDLTAPSTCTADIVQGSWMTFAADLSLEVGAGSKYCAEAATSPESLNQQCFAPPGTTVEVTSDLPMWSCVTLAMGSDTEELHMSSSISLTAKPNEIVSCIAQRE